MKMLRLPHVSKYARRGGAIVLAVAIALFVLGRFGLGTDLWEDVAIVFFAPIFAVSLGLSMTGIPPSPIEAFFSIFFSIAITALVYFFIGALLGTWYEKSRHKVLFLIVAIGLPCILVGAVMAKHSQEEWERWRQDGHMTRAECDKLSDEKKIGECYSHNYGLRFFANDTSDVSICNRIALYRIFDATTCASDFGKWFDENTCNQFDLPRLRAACISRLAPRRDDASLCNTIPEDMMDDTGKNIGREFREGCREQVAEFEEQRVFCMQVFARDRDQRESCLRSLK